MWKKLLNLFRINEISCLEQKINQLIYLLDDEQNKLSQTDSKSFEIESFSFSNLIVDQNLSFELMKDFKFEQEWIPISNPDLFHDQKVGFVSDVLSKSGLIFGTSILSKGMFVAKADPANLVRLASGGFSSMIKGANGQFVGHSGFISAGSSIFTPLAIFQALSLVTGQYYMSGITRQLNSIQTKLDELLFIAHAEKKAILKRSFLFIQKYSLEKNFGIEDLMLLKIAMADLIDVREQYRMMVEKGCEEMNVFFNEDDKFNSKSDSNKIIDKFMASGMFFKLELALKADELYHMSKIVEFHMNWCLVQTDSSRIKIIESKIIDLYKFDYKDTLFKQTVGLYSSTKNGVVRRLRKNKNNSWFNEEEINLKLNELLKQFKYFEDESQNSEKRISQSLSEVTDLLNNPIEILIDTSESIPHLFMKRQRQKIQSISKSDHAFYD